MGTAKVSYPEVAVVDDNQHVRDSFCALLSRSGFNPSIIAANGRQLLDALRSVARLPDICLIDLQMPVMNGYDTIKEIRRKWPELRIIACSVNASPDQVETAIALGADLFYQKGGAPKILIEWMKEAVRNRISST